MDQRPGKRVALHIAHENRLGLAAPTNHYLNKLAPTHVGQQSVQRTFLKLHRERLETVPIDDPRDPAFAS